MAVLKCTRTGVADQTSIGRSTITETYVIQCSAITDDRPAVKDALYTLGMASGYTGYMISGIDANRSKKNPLWWDGEMRYDLPAWPDNSNPGVIDPLLRESVLESTYDEYEEPYWMDHGPTPGTATNSAGQRFNPLLTRRNGKCVIHVVKNYSNFPMATYDAIKYSTNASAVTIKGTTYGMDTLLLLPVLVREATEQIQGIKYHYFATSFRLACDLDLHHDSVPDLGSRDKNGNPIMRGTPPVACTDYPLDGSGNPMPNPTDNPSIWDFQPYPSLNWGLDFN